MAAKDPNLGETFAVPIRNAAASPADSLDVALRMVAGFQHRHKNQHRLSAYWWSPFQQLRRHAEKLRSELQSEQRSEQQLRPAKKRRAVSNAAGSNASTQRARWMRLNIVPKAYLAFSRLVADKQFAPLGLLLLGILAQVRAVLVQVAGDDKAAEEESADRHDGRELIASAPDKLRSNDGNSNDDLGEAVTREAETTKPPTVRLDTAETNTGQLPKQPQPQSQPQSQLQLQLQLQQKQKQKEQKKVKKQQKQSRDDDIDIDQGGVDSHDKQSPVPSSRPAAEKNEQKEHKEYKEQKEKNKNKTDSSTRKKDKKRKRGGDEFDSLFSGLL